MVAEKELPGKWLLAVEFDGATYHSSRSARDRDRLRQRNLENLGWNFLEFGLQTGLITKIKYLKI